MRGGSDGTEPWYSLGAYFATQPNIRALCDVRVTPTEKAGLMVRTRCSDFDTANYIATKMPALYEPLAPVTSVCRNRSSLAVVLNYVANQSFTFLCHFDSGSNFPS